MSDQDSVMHVSGVDLVELGRHITDCAKHADLWCSCKVRQYLDLLGEVGALRQPDVRPIIGGHPEGAIDAVHEFIASEVGWDGGEMMRAQAVDLLNALRGAGYGTVQLDVSAVSGDEAGDG